MRKLYIKSGVRVPYIFPVANMHRTEVRPDG